VLSSGHGHHKRARIAVRGLDRDPAVARHVVDRLERHPGVHARANPLTGRVLVEFDDHQTDIRDLLTDVAAVELPDLPGEDTPSHPLAPAPLVQSATRTTGAALGLGLIAARQVAGVQVSAPGAAQAAGILGILQGFPLTRNGLRALLGRDLSDLVFSGANIIALALSGSPLGLAVTGAEALRLLTEVVARRRAYTAYEGRLDDADAADATPGATVRLEAGQRAPLTAHIVEGRGTAIERDGRAVPATPGATISAGARVQGGPFVVALRGDDAFTPRPRPAPPTPALADRYQQALGPLSLAYAAGTALLTRSPARAFEALLLVNPRAALVGAEAASTGASARALRAGVTVVGTRPGRPIRRPDVLLIDGARALTDGHEVTATLPLTDGHEVADLQAVAAAVATAAGSPWGGAVGVTSGEPGVEGHFDGATATARVGATRYTLGPLAEGESVPGAVRLRDRGAAVLVLRADAGGGDDGHDGYDGHAGSAGHRGTPLALVALRPRLAPGALDLVAACRRHGVVVEVVGQGDRTTTGAVAQRAGIALATTTDAVTAIRARQATGALVAVLSDSAQSAAAFADGDLAIGLTSGRSNRFGARADLLAPDLAAVAAIVEAGARRDVTARDSVALSVAANVAGAAWGWRGGAGIERASYAVYVATLAALADGWARLRGGTRPHASTTRLVDPRPERWGRRSVADTLAALHTTEAGLTAAEAVARRRAAPTPRRRHELLRAILDQVRSPLTGILAAGAALSLVLGSPLDFALIAATVGVNVAVGTWQERRAGQAAAALHQLGAATARVLRDGVAVTVPATDVVPGDILELASGDTVAADARLLAARHLEVDEAALTGESLPVPKAPDGGGDARHVVLEGSDVTVGTGRAVVVAVGRGTRLGATAAALAIDETEQSPLGRRLGRMLGQVLPLAAVGGGIVVGAGVLRGQALLPQLAVGASIAIAAVPEGLPLLAGVGQAAVAGRLATRGALVRRLGSVEALGRVDVACTDKTGTLTEGTLALTDVADLDRDARLGTESGVERGAGPGAAAAQPLPEGLRQVLLAAGLASPHPDAADASAHPTDVAVVAGAARAGLGAVLRVGRTAEAPFDPARAFHATVAAGRLSAKGATEALLPRCDRVRRDGADQPLDEPGRVALRARAEELAGRGLRVLMVAEGGAGTTVTDPQGLVALGFVGISDPLRPDVPAAVRRCQEAGIRVIMLTGDSPATARAIAREAGLLAGGGDVLTGADIADLYNGDLDARLERAAVLARVTPLDKLRIVESLQRHGHVVAMTGDGVNDAPALRLADVGVAMGRGGTEVARQAADVVLADDDFATLVEALVEGRSFWRNIRRALGLLLGGNLGELGLVVGASVLGLASPLVTRQILAVNLITDALPALAVALQRPADRNLAGLAREGEGALDKPLRDDVLRRGVSTAVPALAGYLLALPAGLPQARAVAFAGIVATQLAQTLDAGRAEGGLTRPVLGAVAGSGGLLLATLTVPALRELLLLAAPTPLGWALIAAGAPAAVLLSRTLGAADAGARRSALPVPARPRLLPAPRSA
jgi:cation-transporting ATPase I